MKLLWIFLGARLAQHFAETTLALLNRTYYLDGARRDAVCKALGLSADEMSKTLAYTEDKFMFARFAEWLNTMVTLIFLGVGGLGLIEGWAQRIALSTVGDSVVVTGLAFFALLGLITMVWGLPFEYFRTFVIEQKHGFNRQTKRGFWLDRLKGVVLGCLLGGTLLAALLWVISSIEMWWFWAWFLVSAFSMITAWLYPTFLAPLSNKFKPLPDGELRSAIDVLAERVQFRTAGVFEMDASLRSTHGNAYFTGVFGAKRIVLFDTLVKALSPGEVVAVLAHELGHFKLHHVRWGLIRSLSMSALIFFLLGQLYPLTAPYAALSLSGPSPYGALVVFSLWFGLVDFFLQPLSSWLSRRQEFAADRFAVAHIKEAGELGRALQKLSSSNHSMPITHPLFSRIYYSHPPLLERLAALETVRP